MPKLNLLTGDRALENKYFGTKQGRASAFHIFYLLPSGGDVLQ